MKIATAMKPSLAALLASASVLGCGSAERSSINSTIDDSFYQTEIVNGMPAEYSQFPSIVAVAYEYESADFLTILCTGTLIAPDLVQVAAHCLGYLEPEELYAVYGMEELNSGKGFIIPGREQAIHTEYKPDSGDEPSHDLGLLLLKEKIPDAIVAPILPPEKYGQYLTLGAEVTIAGYGVYDVYDTSGKLYFADVPIVKRNEFEMLVGEGKDVTSPDACSGDSGGPAYVYDDNGKMYLAGVTSRAPLGTPALCGGGTWYGFPGSELSWIEGTYKSWKEPEPSDQEEAPDFEFSFDEEEENSEPDAAVNRGYEKAPNPAIEYPSGGCSCTFIPKSKSNGNSNGSYLLPLVGLLYAVRRREK